MRIRCVSKAIKSISEIPSLWETFVWSYYMPRDDELLEHVLETFGRNVKRFCFADDVAPSKLEGMLKYCKNVTHLSLPKFSSIETLEKMVCHMADLQTLDIHSTNYQLKDILKFSSILKVLAIILYSDSYLVGQVKYWFEEWASSHYMPRKLNLIIYADEWHSLNSVVLSLQSIMKDKSFLKNSCNIACFNICVNTSMEFLPMLPYIQIQVTDAAVTVPLVKASQYRLVGLHLDKLHLTQGSYHGKKVHKALLIYDIDDYRKRYQ